MVRFLVLPEHIHRQLGQLRRLTIGLLLLAGCSTESIVALTAAERNRQVSLSTGDGLDVTLQSIGPGEYASPPTMSSSAVAFLDVAYVGPSVPAGVTQRFRFRAASRGTAIITFTHTGNNSAVQDTVIVR